MQKRNIVWLASYPKSGNTWFRLFLSALLNDTDEIDLNGLKTDGIFSSREIFNAYTDLDSRYLFHDEIKNLLPQVYRQLSNEATKIQYIKVHDAFTFNNLDQPTIPVEATKCALYIIRNPLDVVASFANHMGSTIAKALTKMNDSNGSLATQENNLNTSSQLKQVMLSWSGHVQSWTTQSSFPVLVIRYEDMIGDPIATFSKAADFIGIQATPEKIRTAIELCSFNNLQQKEDQAGFKERAPNAKRFFRSGSSGNWINELTNEQALSIIQHHGETMAKYGYDINLTEASS